MSNNSVIREDPFIPKRRLERSPNQNSPPSKMGLCKVCSKSLRSPEGPYVKCNECNNGYHTHCIGMSDKYVAFLNTMNMVYQCPACNAEGCSKSFLVSKLDEFMQKNR